MTENSPTYILLFSDTGLPPEPLLKQAYEFAHASFDTLRLRVLRRYSDPAEEDRAAGTRTLNEALRLGMDKKDHQKKLAELENLCDQRIAGGLRIANATADREFILTCLSPALEVFVHSDKPTTERIAAAMLAATVRSAKDYESLRQAFAKTAMPGLVAALDDFRAYPEERGDRLRGDKTGARTLHMAIAAAGLKRLMMQAEKLPPKPSNDNASLPVLVLDGKKHFEEARAAWGEDRKMQRHFVETFNAAARAVTSAHRMEIGAKGEPVLKNALLLGPVPKENNPAPPPAGPERGLLGPPIFL